ncbi:ABC transporter permease [Clostridium tertium]|jgi:putative ABC transport system permease protein|uniref:ABC transporter permease n=1 Tax=Clostridium TaxID=1485 RepID=UPI00031D4B2B|nr:MULTISPECIES: FtsX-like permease family protein [Clostridium]MBU6134766.1 ABC transporter permease [Clostridium tertium]MDB1940222.1 ABC transporter permease [Clostridium tertium]MDB1948156.1 ABC transporter permease [Clostridium tertium]MDB1953314.1 ABC transporter permease [Clostridium tertium]MDB1958616.1 ABC transporter permease [Clostridium tertium]
MKFRVLIFTALRNLNRNKKRSILTMIGIIIGIASVITIVALGQGYKNKTIKEFTGETDGAVVLMASFSPETFTEEVSSMEFFNNKHKDSVEGLDSVESVEFQYSSNSFGEYMQMDVRGKVINVLVKPVEEFDIAEDAFGRNLTKNDNLLKNRVIFASEQTLKSNFDDVEKLVGGIATINGISLEIVGIKKAPQEEEISFFNMGGDVRIPKETYDKYFSSIKKVEGLKITLKNDSDVKASIKEIENTLNSIDGNRVKGKYEIIDTSGIVNLLGGVLNTITMFIASVAGISLFIAGIGLMNMMYTSVSERIREIGIKRALGARKKDIRREFLIEGIVITMVGGLVGYILGMIIANIISMYFKLVITPSLFTSLLAIGISIVIGLASSFIPARKAANSNTVDILK